MHVPPDEHLRPAPEYVYAVVVGVAVEGGLSARLDFEVAHGEVVRPVFGTDDDPHRSAYRSAFGIGLHLDAGPVVPSVLSPVFMHYTHEQPVPPVRSKPGKAISYMKLRTPLPCSSDMRSASSRSKPMATSSRTRLRCISS